MKLTQKDVCLQELWQIQNPLQNQLSAQKMTNWLSLRKKQKKDLSSEEMIELSTARNRNLITKKEQLVLRKSRIAFFGLSVGSNAIFSWVMLARPDHLMIADPDYISPTNLNRIRATWSVVGLQKTEWVRQTVQEMSPHTVINSYTNTRNADKIQSICSNKNMPIDVIVDEIDNIDAKISLRNAARALQIPLISAVDVGDNVFLDVERYDIEKPKPFLGRISDRQLKNIALLTPSEKRALVFQIVGLEHNSEKMLDSLLSIGKTIPTWPQLGSTASITGGLVATTIKKIQLGEAVKSGRYYLNLDKLLDASFNSKKRVLIRKKLIKQISNTLL